MAIYCRANSSNHVRRMAMEYSPPPVEHNCGRRRGRRSSGATHAATNASSAQCHHYRRERHQSHNVPASQRKLGSWKSARPPRSRTLLPWERAQRLRAVLPRLESGRPCDGYYETTLLRAHVENAHAASAHNSCMPPNRASTCRYQSPGQQGEQRRRSGKAAARETIS